MTELSTLLPEQPVRFIDNGSVVSGRVVGINGYMVKVMQDNLPQPIFHVTKMRNDIYTTDEDERLVKALKQLSDLAQTQAWLVERKSEVVSV